MAKRGLSLDYIYQKDILHITKASGKLALYFGQKDSTSDMKGFVVTDLVVAKKLKMVADHIHNQMEKAEALQSKPVKKKDVVVIHGKFGSRKKVTKKKGKKS